MFRLGSLGTVCLQEMTILREKLACIVCGAVFYYILKIVMSFWNDDFIENFNPNNFLLPTHKNRNILQTPRILCYINTIPATYFTKAVHVNRTWAKRCSKTIFFSSEQEPSIPIINLNLTKPESRMHLWSKIQKMLRYIYQFRNDFDFFFKCDDDTYLFYENLAKELSNRNPNEPFMMGHRFMRFLNVGYFSGGAGYVLSREALTRIVEKAIDKHPDCPRYDEDKEDVKMSICGNAVGVKNYDALDNNNQSKFSWYNPETFLVNSKWILKNGDHTNMKKLAKDLPMTPHAISYHYVKPEMMYLFDFTVYYLDVFQKTKNILDITSL